MAVVLIMKSKSRKTTTRILITEDDETIRAALSDILSDNGFETVLTVNCREAIQRFDECDLCLLDLLPLHNMSRSQIAQDIRMKE